MYIDADVIIKAASLLSALSVLIGLVIGIYKLIANNKRQSEIIEEIQKEQKIICKGLRGALQGLIEKGCNGPCKEALAILEAHIDDNAHKSK